MHNPRIQKGLLTFLVGLLLFLLFLPSFFFPYIHKTLTNSDYKTNVQKDYAAIILPSDSLHDLGPPYQAFLLRGNKRYNFDFYSHLWFYNQTRGGKFVALSWAPSALLVLLPFPHFPPQEFIKSVNIFLIIVVLIITIIIPLIFLLAWRLFTGEPTPFPKPKDKILGYATLFLISLAFYPLARGLYLHQIQVLIAGLQTLAILLLLTGKENASAVSIGLFASLKPHYLLILPWLALRRRWKALLSALASFATMASLSTIFFGPTNTFTYYTKIVPYLANNGHAYFSNQSINGFLNRLFDNGVFLRWSILYPPYHPIVYYGTKIGTVVLLAVGILLPVLFSRKGKEQLGDESVYRQRNTLELALVILCITMASPISWQHAYACLLPICAMLFPALYSLKPWRKLTLPAFFFAWVFSAYYWQAKYLSGTPLNPLISHMLFSAMLISALIISTLWKLKKLGNSQ